MMKLEVRQMVGRNLKRLRQRAGLTQDALGERLHVTRQAVSAWETGKTAPDVETLAALAAALEVDVRALIYGPEAVEGGYLRFQRRYVVCAAVFAAMTLALLVMEMTLKPYLHQLKGQTFILWPSLTYIMAVVPLGYAAAGALVPALLSLWADIRVQSARVRWVLLAVGLLALGTYLLWVASFLGYGPEVVYEYPLRRWFAAMSTTGNDLIRYSSVTLSGCALFLAFNRLKKAPGSRPGGSFCQESFRSPSRIQPMRRKNSPNAQQSTAGRMKHKRAMASQSMPVMAALAPVATSLTQPV